MSEFVAITKSTSDNWFYSMTRCNPVPRRPRRGVQIAAAGPLFPRWNENLPDCQAAQRHTIVNAEPGGEARLVQVDGLGSRRV